MIYFRVLIFVIALLLIIYYVQLIEHILGYHTITYQRVTIIKCVIPFYFWLT